MSAQHLKITPALFPILAAALLASACSDSTAPGGDPVVGTESTSSAVPAGAPTGGPDDGSALKSVTPKPAFATRTTTWAAPGATVGKLNIPRGATFCSGMPVGRYVKVSGMDAALAGGNVATLHQLVTADVDLYRWTGSAWAYQRTLRSSVSGSVVIPVNPLPAVKFNLSAAGYYHIMVRATWWADLGTGSWIKKASAVYAFDTLADYDNTGVGTLTYPGYCWLQ